MANIRKQFNFRNGVQVDDDNFIVNPNGLVGIGTSVPTEFLDVHGTAKVTGLVTATNLAITGVSNFFDDVKVGSGITFNPSTGVVNATTFVGSAAGLTGIFAIAVEGWIVNAGNISTTSNVGLGNTLPNYSLQVGEDPLIGNGLSIDAGAGDVNTTGIITASSFSGIGAGITDINATSITSGTLNNSRLPQNIIATSFIGTATTATSVIGGIGSITQLQVTGISTLGVTSVSSLFVSGVTTSVGGFVGNVTGIASFASNLTGSPDITVSNIISGVSSIGISTVSTRLYAESIGVGTNSPSSDIHIRRSSQSRLQVTSDTAEAIVAVGRSTGLTGSNGIVRFGNVSGLYPYSTPYSMDVMNFDKGNMNFYLEANGFVGINTGHFHWHRKTTETLMSLTYDGNLGIGKTNPTVSLDVVGTTTCINAFVNTDLYVGNNSTIGNDLTVEGNIVANSGFTLSSGSINANLNGNVNASSGVSTFSTLILNDNLLVNDTIGIGGFTPQDLVSNPDIKFGINPNSSVSFLVNNLGQVAIGVTEFLAEGINAPDRTCVFGGVGVGTDRGYLNVCPVDFTFAGRRALDIDGNNPFVNREYMRVPVVTTTERNNFTGLIGGEIIYNKTTNKHQGYNGSTWNDLY